MTQRCRSGQGAAVIKPTMAEDLIRWCECIDPGHRNGHCCELDLMIASNYDRIVTSVPIKLRVERAGGCLDTENVVHTKNLWTSRRQRTLLLLCRWSERIRNIDTRITAGKRMHLPCLKITHVTVGLAVAMTAEPVCLASTPVCPYILCP